MRNYFKTAKRLRIAIDNAHRIQGFQDYLNEHFLLNYELKFNSSGYMYELPYWIESKFLNTVNDNEKYIVEYIPSYHISWPRIGDSVDLADGTYQVIDTVPLDSEIELQADDGGYAYAYMGMSYLKVYQQLN